MFISAFNSQYEGTNPYSRLAHKKAKERKQNKKSYEDNRDVSSVIIAVEKESTEILKIIKNNFEEFSNTGNQKTKLLIRNYYKKMEDSCKTLGVTTETELKEDDQKRRILENLKEGYKIAKLTDIV